MVPKMTRAVGFAALVLLTLIPLAGIQVAMASKGGGNVSDSNKDKKDGKNDPILIKKADDPVLSGSGTAAANSTAVRFATLPLNSPEIVLVAESAHVSVSRVAGLNEVILSSNCPRNWSIQGTAVRQAGFSVPRKGTAMMADVLGSRAIVNGQVYLLPQQMRGGMKLGADGVFIAGQKIDPLKGSDIPGNCGGEDFLEVKVPESFTGDLKIGSAGKSNIELSSWKNGSFMVALSGEGSISSTGKMEGLEKAVIDNRGKGSADFSEIVAKAVVANVSGEGSVSIKRGTAEMSNATVAGTGKISLPGKYKNLKQQVDGKGSIEVLP